MKTLIKRTALFLLLATGSLAILYSYRDSLLLTLTSTQLENHSQKLFGAPLCYKEKRIERGALVLEQPSFCQGDATFTAEQLTIQPTWLPQFKGVHVKATITGPTLTPSALPLSRFSGNKFWLAKAFRVKWECEVEGGTLHSRGPVPLSGRVSGENSRKISLALTIGEGNLKLAYSSSLREKRIGFEVDHLSLTALSSFLWPQGWEAAGVVTSAAGSLHRPSRGLPWIEGIGEIEKLVACGPNAHLDISNIQFNLAPNRHLRRRDLARLSLWDDVALALNGQIVLHGECLQIGDLQWKDARGVLNLGADESILTLLTADAKIEGSVSKSPTPMRKAVMQWGGDEHCQLTMQRNGETTVHCASLTPQQTKAIQALFSPFLPLPISHTQGTLSATASALLRNGEIHDLWVSEILASNLSLSTRDSQFHVGELVGHLSLPHFKQGWAEECSARLLIEEGSYTKDSLSLDHLTGELLMDRGTLERLTGGGTLGGLAFQASALPLPHARAVRVHVSGTIADVTTLWQSEVLTTYFADDPFSLNIQFERAGLAIDADGVWEVGGDRLPFQFSLSPQRKPSLALLPVERIANQLLPPPKSRFPLEIGPAKILAFDGGRIEAKRVEAAKFIQPLLKGHEGLFLYGTVDLKASFDGEELGIDYEGYNMRLEAPLFRITIPRVGDLSPLAPDEERASHQFNLLTGAQGGLVPLKHATYIEKHSGLVFTHIQGHVDLHSKGLIVPNMTGICEDVAFGGSVDMIRYAGVPTDLKLHAKWAEGPLPGAQRILDHISPSSLWKLKAEGTARLEEDGLDLRILFLRPKSQVEASVSGGIGEAFWENGHGLVLQGMGAGFSYEHEGKHLAFQNLTGEACFQSGESYPLLAPQLAFDNFPSGNAHFFLTMGNLAELRGELLVNSEGEKRLSLRTSHFGGIKPALRLCTIHNGLQKIRLLLEINAETLARDLRLLEQIATLPLGASLASCASLTGLLTGELTFDQALAWQGHLNGKRLTAFGHPFKSTSLTLASSGDGWEVLAKADKLSAKARLQGKEVAWGEIAYASDLAAHFSGKLNAEQFEGVFSDCAVSLLAASNLPYLRSLTFLQTAAGSCELTGPFQIGARGLSADLLLNMNGIAVADTRLNGSTPLHCTFEQGILTVEDLLLLPSPIGEEPCQLQLGKLTFTPESETLSLADLQFQLKQELLPWAASQMDVLFNQALPFDLTRVPSLKEGYAGSLSYGCGVLEVTLADGEYLLGEHRLPISGAHITSTADHLSAAANAQIRGESLRLSFFQHKTRPDKGELQIACDDESIDPLTLFWNFPKGSPPRLTRLEGGLKGITAKLTAESVDEGSDTLILFGSVELDGNRVSSLLPEGLSTFMEKAKLGMGYQLSGRFELPTDDLTQGSFIGDLSGRQFEAGGYQFERLSASLFFSPSHFSIHSLSISDPTGRLSIDSIEGRKGTEEWTFEAPLVRITNFQPTILKGTYKPYGKNKPLTITTGEIHHFSGTTDPATWSGVGSLSFRHPPKREVSNTLFALPDDLLGILGLDFQSLIPAAGRVNFTIGNGKCTLSSFADVHSRGRRSQFFLADDEPSYIDFDGNVCLRVRTKQYNLILKITELFTVAIGGTLDKPTFRLQHPNRTNL